MRLKTCAAILLALFAGAQGLRARDPVVWSALVLATNNPAPHEPAAELAPLAGKLKNVFGYNQFEVIGSHSEKMDNAQERWLLPSKSFFLHVSSQKVSDAEYLLRLQLYQDKRMLVETKANLSSQSPLFIRGPLYADGQLIIVLLLE